MIGKRIPKLELQARWAYSELCSSRFASLYATWKHSGNAHIFQSADASAAFDTLQPSDVAELAWMNCQLRAPLQSYVATNEYICSAWTKQQLGCSFVIPHVAPQQRVDFRFSAWVGIKGTDVSNIVEAMPGDSRFVQTEPVPLAVALQGFVLFDGYLRSSMFMRFATNEKIWVWLPN